MQKNMAIILSLLLLNGQAHSIESYKTKKIAKKPYRRKLNNVKNGMKYNGNFLKNQVVLSAHTRTQSAIIKDRRVEAELLFKQGESEPDLQQKLLLFKQALDKLRGR